MKQLNISMLLALLPLFIQAQNTVSGTITDSENNQPLEQVSVYIPQLEKGSVTVENGNYAIKDLPEGKYKLIIALLGYETYSTTLEINAGENQLRLMRWSSPPLSINWSGKM